jgi:hypothetical protein
MKNAHAKNMRRGVLPLAALAFVLAGGAGGDASADGGVQSTAPVYWFYDTVNPVGTASLVRTPNGLSAVVHTSELLANQAVTLWFIFFNSPEECTVPGECDVPLDLGRIGVDADFHAGGGVVTGASGQATFAGRLQVGDVSGSGLLELDLAPPIALEDPYSAYVVLALHSHGPRQTGQILRSQISTFAGGCDDFLGPNGFATSPYDVPTEVGECSTIQYSRHKP